jgi:ferredoxin
MAKVPKVKQDICIGCGSCESICPAVFKVDDSGKAQVQPADYEANQDDIDQALAACPVGAIVWEE